MTPERRIRGCIACLLVAALAACSPAPSSAGPSSGTDASPQPTLGAPSGASVTVRRTDFQVVYRLEGVSEVSDVVGLSSNRQLVVVPSLPNQSTVEAGQTVGTIRVAPDVAAALTASEGSSRIDKGRLAQLRSLAGPVVAPVSGLLRVTPGSTVVEAPGIDVVVGLTPLQDLRYQSLQFSGRAVIETVVGQREVPCEAVWIARPEVSQTQADNSTDVADVASDLHCRLPRYVETAPRLRARVVLESEHHRDAVVVPNVYVGYDPASDGYYITVMRDGRRSTVDVTVGPTDGVVRVITSPAPVGAVLVPIEQTP